MNFKTKFISAIVGSMMIVGIATAEKNPDFKPELESIYDNIIKKNVHIATEDCNALRKQIDMQSSNPEKSGIKDAFLKFHNSWRAVQVNYILGDLNEDYLDHPQFIDNFHYGKENLYDVIQHALDSGSPAEKALFKNSTKSLNSLEYVIYRDLILDKRDIEFAQVMAINICKRVAEIEEGYEQARDEYLSEPDKSLAALVNALATSIFSTKEWRIGDPAGLTKKYSGKPGLERSETPYAYLNFLSLKSIYKAQKEMVDSKAEHKNLYHILQKFKAQKVGDDINKTLDKVLAKLEPITSDAMLFKPENIKPIYDLSSDLYKFYYISLISALPVVAKVMDADGD